MRMVIKVGTSTLAHASGRLNIRRSEALCRVLRMISFRMRGIPRTNE